MRTISINQVLSNPEELKDSYYNFYDWFCKDESLKNRFYSFLPKLKFLVSENIVNGDTNYIWFKNNCPMNGSLYDDMRISTIINNDYLGGFCPKSKYKYDILKCQIWTLKDGDFNQFEFENWNEFKKMKQLKIN